MGASATTWAQNWTGNAPAEGTYYLYNVGQKKFLTSGNWWGTHAALDTDGMPITLVAAEGAYKLSTTAAFNGKTVSAEAWMDNGNNNTWTFKQVGESDKYILKSGDNYLVSTSEIIADKSTDEPTTDNGYWQLVTKEQLIANLANATEENPIEASFFMTNPKVRRNWPKAIEGTALSDNGSFSADASGLYDGGCTSYGQYRKTFDNYQALSVVNGKYRVSVKGFYRQAEGYGIPYLYANDVKQNLKVKEEIGGDNATNATKALVDDTYLVDAITVDVVDKTLRIGVKSDTDIDWCTWREFTIMYLGPIKDLTPFVTAYETALGKAEELSNSLQQATIKDALNQAISKYGAVDKTSQEALEEATTELNKSIVNSTNSIELYKTINTAIINLTAQSGGIDISALTTKYNNGLYTALSEVYPDYLAIVIPALGSDADTDFTPAIINPGFEFGDMTGWSTPTGGNDTGAKAIGESGSTYYMSNAEGTYLFNSWATSIKTLNLSQTIKGLPAGKYKLEAVVGGFDDGALINLTANNASNGIAPEVATSVGYDISVECMLGENEDLVIGANNTGKGYTLFKADNFRLTYLGADLTTYIKAYEEALSAAQNALDNSDYANVSGSERTELESTISNYSTPTATMAWYAEAQSALEAKTKAFTDAKASYDLLAEANEFATGTDLPYADSSKKPSTVTATSAAGVSDAIANLYNNLRAYYESNAKAENVSSAVDMTDRILNHNATDGYNNWTWEGSKNEPRNKESWTDSKGKNDYMYFDGGNWNGSNWTTTMSQEISLPAGQYLLTAKGRASGNTSLIMSVGQVNVDLPHVGAAGNVFDRGWNDGYLVFETDGSAVTILVTAKANPEHEWFSVGDFRLVQLEAISVPMADETDYSNLASAIEIAEGKTLGFESGEYAPYTNVEALQALAAAKKINPEAAEGNTKELVQTATSNLSNATWTPNTEAMNAVYNGNFANSTANTTSGSNLDIPGWTPSGSFRQIIEDGVNGTFPALSETTGNKAAFTWSGTFQYGDQVGYTMPLAAHTIYELSFKHAGWNGANNGFGVKITSANGDVLSQQVCGKSEFGPQRANCWNTYKIFFVTNDKVNAVLNMIPSGNSSFTDIVLRKVESLEFADGSVPNYAPGTYPSVTINREFSSDKWSTAVYPFAVSASNIAVLESYDAASGTLAFKSANTNTSTANVPFLLKNSGAITLNNVEVQAAAATDATAGNASLKGVYASTEVDNTAINYVLSNNTIYKVGANKATVNPYRAYIQLAETAGAARELTFTVDGEATAIEGIATEKAMSGEIYNLNGQRVKNAKKGIYVVNGKAVIVK